MSSLYTGAFDAGFRRDGALGMWPLSLPHLIFLWQYCAIKSPTQSSLSSISP